MIRHFKFQILFYDFKSAVSCCSRKNKNSANYCVVESEFGDSWYVADIESVRDTDFQYTIYF